MPKLIAILAMTCRAIHCSECSGGYHEDGISIKPGSYGEVESNVPVGSHLAAVAVKDQDWGFAIGEQNGGPLSGNPPVFSVGEWQTRPPRRLGGLSSTAVLGKIKFCSAITKTRAVLKSSTSRTSPTWSCSGSWTRASNHWA